MYNKWLNVEQAFPKFIPQLSGDNQLNWFTYFLLWNDSLHSAIFTLDVNSTLPCGTLVTCYSAPWQSSLGLWQSAPPCGSVPLACGSLPYPVIALSWFVADCPTRGSALLACGSLPCFVAALLFVVVFPASWQRSLLYHSALPRGSAPFCSSLPCLVAALPFVAVCPAPWQSAMPRGSDANPTVAIARSSLWNTSTLSTFDPVKPDH